MITLDSSHASIISHASDIVNLSGSFPYTNYLKTKDIWKSDYSKKYFEENEGEIKLCKASKRAFDESLLSDTSAKTADSYKKKLPSLKALRADYAELMKAKRAAYAEYCKAKDEYRKSQIRQICSLCSASKMQKLSRRRNACRKRIKSWFCYTDSLKANALKLARTGFL